MMIRGEGICVYGLTEFYRLSYYLYQRYKFLNIVIQYIHKLKNRGKTIVLSCHNPSIPLLLNADVVVLERGKVKMTGKAREVLTLQTLCDIYGCEFIAGSQLPYEEASLLPIEK